MTKEEKKPPRRRRQGRTRNSPPVFRQGSYAKRGENKKIKNAKWAATVTSTATWACAPD
jgi:hypothetical protein